MALAMADVVGRAVDRAVVYMPGASLDPARQPAARCCRVGEVNALCVERRAHALKNFLAVALLYSRSPPRILAFRSRLARPESPLSHLEYTTFFKDPIARVRPLGGGCPSPLLAFLPCALLILE